MSAVVVLEDMKARSYSRWCCGAVKVVRVFFPGWRRQGGGTGAGAGRSAVGLRAGVRGVDVGYTAALGHDEVPEGEAWPGPRETIW